MKLKLNRKEEPFVFEVTNDLGARLIVDAASNIGGKNKGLRPMELLASGLASCIAIDVLLILQKQRLSTESFDIEIDGKRSEGVPSPFETIQLRFHIDASVDKIKFEKNVQLVIDKYCSVAASLKDNIKIVYEIN